MFRLSGPSQQQDLVHEFALHDGVVALATGSDDQPALTVETADTHTAIWDVRSTVGIFDDQATEVPDSGEGESA
ncbi:MAG: hypothetical protein JWQ70_3204 [Aeromicrobium sp.]|jgi:hypothetical protein|nr:hypothetical protein [Aeromicrobium sp.]